MASLFEINCFPFTIESVIPHVFTCRTETSPERPFCELIYKFSGRSEQTIGELSFTFGPDMLLFIPAGTVNRAVITESGETISVSFTPLIDGPTSSLTPEYLSCGTNTRWRAVFQELLRSWQLRTPQARFHCQALLSDILGDVAAQREKQYLDSAHYRRIAPAVDYIRANYLEPVSIGDLTALCGISQQYLHRMFRHYIGMPPIDWVISLRLEYARELLRDSTVTVEAAAQASGFQHVSYFSRAYKKRYLVSPGQGRGDYPSAGADKEEQRDD